MALKVPQDASLILLDDLVTAVLDGCTLRTYSNAHTPTDLDTVGDYTENTYPGYAGISLAGWPAAAINIDGKAEIEHTEKVFTAGAIVTPQSVYGIYVTDGAGDLIYAELNPGGVVSMAVPGQGYGYTPRFTLVSEF